MVGIIKALLFIELYNVSYLKVRITYLPNQILVRIENTKNSHYHKLLSFAGADSLLLSDKIIQIQCTA